MGISRRRRLGFVAALAGVLVACNVVIGLNEYTTVPCAFDCGGPDVDGVDGGDASDAADADASSAADAWPGDAVDGKADAPQSDALQSDASPAPLDASTDGDADGADSADVEADASDAGVTDAAVEADAEAEGGGPTPEQIRAHWPMPNPDASIGPESSALLPNQMAYDASDATVVDLVTHLVWQRDGTRLASDYATAQAICADAGSRLPTRIELVSLIDFTQQGAVVNPTAFPSTVQGVYWTSSLFASDGGEYWTVSFSTGLVDRWSVQQAQYVQCVQGGSQ